MEFNKINQVREELHKFQDLSHLTQDTGPLYFNTSSVNLFPMQLFNTLQREISILGPDTPDGELFISRVLQILLYILQLLKPTEELIQSLQPIQAPWDKESVLVQNLPDKEIYKSEIFSSKPATISRYQKPGEKEGK